MNVKRKRTLNMAKESRHTRKVWRRRTAGHLDLPRTKMVGFEEQAAGRHDQLGRGSVEPLASDGIGANKAVVVAGRIRTNVAFRRIEAKDRGQGAATTNDRSPISTGQSARHNPLLSKEHLLFPSAVRSQPSG